jgi:hypothetical protein
MKTTIACCIIALTLLTGAGRVQTKDGKTVEGNVSLEDGAVRVGQIGLPWDQVTRLTLQSKAAPHTEVAANGSTLPQDWKNQDIGTVHTPGTASCDANGTFNLTASGWGAWGAQDSLHFVYRTLEGDGQIIAHIAKLDATHGPVVAGVMIRQSLAPDAPTAGACLYPNGQVRLPHRPETSLAEFKHTDEAPQLQGWIRLTRRGEQLTSFRSTDGKFWQRVETREVPMNQSVLIGVAAWTTGNAWVGAAQLDSVRIIPGAPSLSYFPDGDPLAAGIVLRDGNSIAAQVTGMDETSVEFERDSVAATLPRAQVARLVFSPLPPDNAAPGDHAGILLTGGDFIEGDGIAVNRQRVDWPRPPQLKATVRSVLFGARAFEIAREVIAIDLAPIAPAPATYEVRTADGSLIRANTITVQKNGVTIDGKLTPNVTDIRKL